MNIRESFVLAIADQPGDDSHRLIFADWLDDHGEPERAAFIRASCEAATKRPGTRRRAELLDQADDLRARHEADWLGEWRDRLLDWDFSRGFLNRVRLTANTFLAHGEDLFRREPVGRVELVNDTGNALDADAVRAVVAHPAFVFVRDCAILPHAFLATTPLNVWMAALVANPRVTRLRRLGPIGDSFNYDSAPNSDGDGIDQASFTAFCQAGHLRTLRHLDLTVERINAHVSRDWLIPTLARASFAGSLRTLILAGTGVTAAGFQQVATDAAFAGLARLDLRHSQVNSTAWACLFNSTTLTKLTTFTLGANLLPAYARSPLARRVRNLTVQCADDLDRNMSADRRAWLELIVNAPPPRRLTLDCHNPGKEVFAAMRKARWLRDVRELSISGDSQYEVYSGRTAGIRSLFGQKSMPKLGTLNLHEACNRRVLATLAEWPGTAHLEKVEATDDYHGRLIPSAFEPATPPDRLRHLEGVVLILADDAARFLALPRLDRLARLKLSFSGEYDQATREFLPRLSPDVAEQVIRSPGLANVTEMTLGFHYLPAVAERLAVVLADPAVMPCLRHLTFYGSFGNDLPSMDNLRARFGSRLVAF